MTACPRFIIIILGSESSERDVCLCVRVRVHECDFMCACPRVCLRVCAYVCMCEGFMFVSREEV